MKQTDMLSKRSIYKFTKRMNDIIISIFNLIILFPLFIIISICIKIDSKGPVFFLHERLGKNGRKIKIWKFRTMTTDINKIMSEYDENQMKEYKENFKLKDDTGITKIGKILRKTNLDELPQFINIIKGDLSLIGPRPVMEEEVEKYGNKKNEFLSVTPGLTGYWVVNRKENTSYAERMKMELYYVHNNFWIIDVEIFLKTILLSIKNICLTRK